MSYAKSGIAARDLLECLKAHPDFPIIEAGWINGTVNEDKQSEYPPLVYKNKNGEIRKIRYINPTAEKPISNRGASSGVRNGKNVEASLGFSRENNSLLYELVQTISTRYEKEMKVIMTGDSPYAMRWKERCLPKISVPLQDKYKDPTSKQLVDMPNALFRVKFDYSDKTKTVFKNKFNLCETKPGATKASFVKTLNDTILEWKDKDKNDQKGPFGPATLQHAIKSGSTILALWDCGANVSAQGNSFKIIFVNDMDFIFIQGTGASLDEEAELGDVLDFGESYGNSRLAASTSVVSNVSANGNNHSKDVVDTINKELGDVTLSARTPTNPLAVTDDTIPEFI